MILTFLVRCPARLRIFGHEPATADRLAYADPTGERTYVPPIAAATYLVAGDAAERPLLPDGWRLGFTALVITVSVGGALFTLLRIGPLAGTFVLAYGLLMTAHP